MVESRKRRPRLHLVYCEQAVFRQSQIDPPHAPLHPLSLKVSTREPSMHAITNLARLSSPPSPALFLINLWFGA